MLRNARCPAPAWIQAWVRAGAPLLLILASTGCHDAPPPRPHVVLLIVDTLRADHLGLYGYSRPTSPALDRFAAESNVFENVFAAAPWTLPSVGSVMTGTYPAVHGLRARIDGGRLLSMRGGLETLAEVMREAGYRTVAAVANPWIGNRKHGLHRGYDEFRELRGGSADDLHAFARAAFESDDSRPVFLYLHYMDVHGPFNQTGGNANLGPPPPFYQRKMTTGEMKKIPGYLRIPKARKLAAYIEAYDQGIRAWDESFGEFVAWLQTTGRIDDTIVVVISDHGEEFLEHGGWNHGATLYREQLFVPWLMRIPGVPPRRHRGRPASLIDVSPTILGAIGIGPPGTMLGRDLLRDDVPAKRPLFSETEILQGGQRSEKNLQHSILQDGVHAITSPTEGARCFDLARDPTQQHPIPIGEGCDPTLFERLRSWAEEAARTGRSLGEQSEFELLPAERERLRELGYGE